MPAKSATALSAAAQKAWATRRARAAALASSAPIAASAAIVLPAPVPAKPVQFIACDTSFMAPKAPAKQAAGDVFERVEAFQMVEMFVDDAVLGCGFRRFMVLEQSQRLVRLFCVPRLTAITVDRKSFERKAKPARHVRKRVLVDILRSNRAMADRVNERAQSEILNDGGAYADRALALLTA